MAGFVGGGRRRKMQHDVSQASDTAKTGRMIKIGNNGNRASVAPPGTLHRIAQQGENPVAPDQARQRAARHIAATDNQ